MNFTAHLKSHSKLPCKWIVCFEDKILLAKNNTLPETTDTMKTPDKFLSQLPLGYTESFQYIAAMLTEPENFKEDFDLVPLKQCLLTLTEEEQSIALYGKHLSYWHHHYQHCVRCGNQLVLSTIERMKICQACSWPHYPVVSPAIIVLIKKGHEFLLAQARHFLNGMYSLIAGFVEPGETLEQCVAREVKEEVGIQIKNITYQFSQPWPFPHSLMVGFIADYDSGEITIDNHEIIAADWFSKEKLPERLPSQSSIARKILEFVIKQA